MKPKTMALMIVAVGCGLAASYMTSKLLAERREQPPPEEKIKLLVTKTHVPKNTVLKEPEKFFEIRERAKTEEPKEKYFTEFAQLKDKRLKKALKPDVHATPDDLQDRSTTTLDVPPGYGGFGLRVNAASLAGGYVWPGDKVDIILTGRAPKITARTVLKDVLVLAVGERTTREGPDGGGGSLQANTVSVALLPEDAAKVRVAESLGELSLWLHGSDEDVKHSAKVITEDDILRPGQGGDASVAVKPVVKTEPTKLPLIDMTLPEVEQLANKKDPPKTETEPEPVRPDWTLTIYPGFDPPIQQHYFKRSDGGILRDDPDPAAAKKEKDKKDK